MRPQVEDYFSDARGENSIESIFYSPKQNSCLYLLISVENISDEFFSSWEIRDVFTNKVLEIFSSLPYVTSTVSNVSEFQEKIEEYQN
ncbi:MAG: hypothetical protein K9L85_04000 [Candidatus Peribacteraceae bacterium]|nr:hypothetical protein [Candidatus Peribacteraceae bacterium]